MSPPISVAYRQTAQTVQNPNPQPALRLVAYQPRVEGLQPSMVHIDKLFFNLLEGRIGQAIAMVEGNKNLVPYLTAYITDPDRKVSDNAMWALNFISGRADWEMRIRLNVSLSKFRFSKWMDKLSHEDNAKHETIRKDVDSILFKVRKEIPS